jgi:hypothetical protein
MFIAAALQIYSGPWMTCQPGGDSCWYTDMIMGDMPCSLLTLLHEWK